jgi:hypothetical protein
MGASVKRFVSLHFLDLINNWQVSLDGGSVRLKAAVYKGKHKHTFTPRVGFEFTTPMFERAQAEKSPVAVCSHRRET